jgi:tRNA dimethylallyltransferase
VEIALLTGVSISRWHREAPRPPSATARYLVVDPGPALAARIQDRVDAMLVQGWPEEVEGLVRAVDADAPAWKATGYGAIREMVQGSQTREAARMRIIVETRQYAKRQRTWFRHQLAPADVTRVDPAAPDAKDRVWQWWHQPDEA